MLYSEQMKLEKCESFYISALNISPVKSCTFPGEILWYFLFSVQQKMCREREVDGSMSFTLFTDMHSSCLMEIKMLPIITASRWKKTCFIYSFKMIEQEIRTRDYRLQSRSVWFMLFKQQFYCIFLIHILCTWAVTLERFPVCRWACKTFHFKIFFDWREQ